MQMVRGNPAVEGTYIGFVEDEDFVTEGQLPFERGFLATFGRWMPDFRSERAVT